MTLALIIVQGILYVVATGLAYWEACPKWVSCLIVGGNIAVSCFFGWSPLTILLLVGAVFVGCCGWNYGEERRLPFSLYIASWVGGLFWCVFFAFYFLLGMFGFEINSNEFSKTETSIIEIYSMSDKGISNTTVTGSSNLLFGTVTGNTKLSYYYGYYYMNENGALKIGFIPADETELYTIYEGETPHIKVFNTYNKTKNWFTALDTGKHSLASTRYEIYIPKSAMPNTFQLNNE